MMAGNRNGAAAAAAAAGNSAAAGKTPQSRGSAALLAQHLNSAEATVAEDLYSSLRAWWGTLDTCIVVLGLDRVSSL